MHVDTDVFMLQPPGFVEGFNLVCHLLKCLYGLKQAPRMWYEMLKAALRELGFEPQLCDTSFWVCRLHKCIIYLTSVVDDMLVTSAIPSFTIHIIQQIMSKFKGTHGGVAHHYCGMKLTWQPKDRTVKLSQQAYIDKVVTTFQSLAAINPRTTPMDPDVRIVPVGVARGQQHFESPLLDVTVYPYMTLIGALNYLACCTRPHIAYTVNQLAKVNNALTVAHWKAAIHCLGYLKATHQLGIVLGHSSTPAIAYVDSSHGTGTPDQKPVAGHVLLVHGGPVTWTSMTQQLTSTSSTEAEYRALSDSVKDVLWPSQILSCFNVLPRPFPMMSDNMRTIKAAMNHTTTKHTKHIELHVQFLRERVQRSEVDITHVPGTDNLAGLFTSGGGQLELWLWTHCEAPTDVVTSCLSACLTLVAISHGTCVSHVPCPFQSLQHQLHGSSCFGKGGCWSLAGSWHVTQLAAHCVVT
jgi:Reverse transcriptase (RNA-dependent DNA polymerase)